MSQSNFGGSPSSAGDQPVRSNAPIVPPTEGWSARKELAPPPHEEASENDSIQETADEIRDMNHHTNSIEFHGPTSSMAFFALVDSPADGSQSIRPHGTSYQSQLSADRSSLVSSLHNIGFSPDSNFPPTKDDVALKDQDFYFRHSRLFLEGYFDNIHYIHPIISKDGFLNRCEDLWFGRVERQTWSFIALYYSVLSLGAIIRVWDEAAIDGLDRFQWSRKLFNHARLSLGKLRSANDLETVQCLIIMVCYPQTEAGRG